VRQRTFDELVRHLRDQREMGEPAPVVLLGAGASKDAGIEDMKGLYDLIGVDDFEEFAAYINDWTPAERYALLGRYLASKKPEKITAGYRALAALCAHAFFDIVLSTNLDPLMDDALAGAALWRRDYVVLVNGVLQPQRVEPVLTSRHPRVKVVKLHGDLYLRFMAWTRNEMNQYVAEVEGVLAPAIRNRDVLVVGQSLRDEGVRRLVLGTGGLVWFATPGTVPAHLADIDQVRVVHDERCRFERLFPAIAKYLRIEHEPPASGEPSEAKTATTPTMDDLMAAVVGVYTSQDMPTGTGFLLANPRVIVTDLLAPQSADAGVWVMTGDGRRIQTRIVAMEDQPLSAVVLALSHAVTEGGLALGPAAVPPAGMHVTLAVAAGDFTGISDGEVVSGTEETLDVAPVGRVSGLVRIRAMTAPGSIGAPVVDDAMRVVGMVVAGATDADNPQTFMLPIERWRHLLP
jgi:SIR2-like domain